jgi:cytosine/adenosine deaminase-related metal-dependent hydrolase
LALYGYRTPTGGHEFRQRFNREADAGRLAVGSHADFVAVDVNSVRTAGGGATVENVVFGANASDVTDVAVDGRTLVAGRRHLSVPDPASELASAISDLMDTPS